MLLAQLWWNSKQKLGITAGEINLSRGLWAWGVFFSFFFFNLDGLQQEDATNLQQLRRSWGWSSDYRSTGSLRCLI